MPRLFLIEAEYDLAVRQAEATWIRELLTEFTDGTLPGLDVWRDWHERGADPAELAAVMDKLMPGGDQPG